MKIIFEELIQSYLENNIGITESFLDIELAQLLREKLASLHLHNQLQDAGIGNNLIIDHDKLIRKDKIHWLDRKNKDRIENRFLDLIDQFVLYLNQTCYSGITDYEFHYSFYNVGSFYKKHIDQFKNDNGRVYSLIVYLNTDWIKINGGELCIHHEDHLQYISPMCRKAVLFKSNELKHEVMVTHVPRMSITGWLKIKQR